MNERAKFYATKVGDMYGTGDRWCGVELTIIKDGIQITLTSDEVRELAGCMDRVGLITEKWRKTPK